MNKDTPSLPLDGATDPERGTGRTTRMMLRALLDACSGPHRHITIVCESWDDATYWALWLARVIQVSESAPRKVGLSNGSTISLLGPDQNSRGVKPGHLYVDHSVEKTYAG